MLICSQQNKEHNGSLHLVLHSYAMFLPHHRFLRRHREFSWLLRFLYHFALISLFLKEEERCTEGRSLSTRSTENLPCWGLGTACHTHKETVSWMSETPWANRKVSSKRWSQKNRDWTKLYFWLFFWYLSNSYLTVETAKHQTAELFLVSVVAVHLGRIRLFLFFFFFLTSGSLKTFCIWLVGLKSRL